MTEAWFRSPGSPDSPSGLPATSAQLSDAELCAQIRRHGPDSGTGRTAFGELFARHRMPALHLALRLNRDRSRAEDAVAEAFAKVWRAWLNGNGPTEAFKAYLMAAVRSESYRRTATTRATSVVEPAVLTFLAGSEASDHSSEIAERDQLARAFTSLPKAWQNALTMIDIDGTPTTSAAESMDLSSNSFSSLLRRAREGLRVAYLQEHVEPSRPECAEFTSELARYVRKQLSAKRTAALEAHLSRCKPCRLQSFRLRSLNTTFKAWITPAALAAALIEIDHFPLVPGFLAPGSAVSGTTSASSGSAGQTLLSAHAGASAETTAGGSTAGGSITGIAAGTGITTAKLAIATIVATAVVAVSALTFADFWNSATSQAASSVALSPSPASSTVPQTTSGNDHGDEAEAGTLPRSGTEIVKKDAGSSAPNAHGSTPGADIVRQPAGEPTGDEAADRAAAPEPTTPEEPKQPAPVTAERPASPDAETVDEPVQGDEPVQRDEPVQSDEPAQPVEPATPSKTEPEPNLPTPPQPSPDADADESSQPSEPADEPADDTAEDEPSTGGDSTADGPPPEEDASTGDEEEDGADNDDSDDSDDDATHCHRHHWWHHCH